MSQCEHLSHPLRRVHAPRRPLDERCQGHPISGDAKRAEVCQHDAAHRRMLAAAIGSFAIFSM